MPLDPVLLERGEIPHTQDDLGAAAAQLVERGGKLSDMGRIAHVDRGGTRTETDPFGPARRGHEQQPGVLVVNLVGAVAGYGLRAVRVVSPSVIGVSALRARRVVDCSVRSDITASLEPRAPHACASSA